MFILEVDRRFNNLKELGVYKKMSFINISDPKKRDEIVKSFLATKKNIQQQNINEKIGDLAQAEDRKQMFEPIVKSNLAAAEEISKDLVPIRRELEHLNQEIALANVAQPALSGLTPLGLLPPETPQRRRSLPLIPTPVQVGKMPIDYLRQALSNKKDNDPVFGIYNEGNQFMIGSKPIRIDGNDIYINDHKWEMTRGMWALLTKKDPEGYSADDMENYKQILYDTNALYQQNDPNTGKPKSSRSSKWALVKPFWFDRPSNKKYDSTVLQPSQLSFAEGKGMTTTVYLSEDPVELTNRLQLLVAEYQAGNKTTQNEIVAIADELFRKGIFDEKQYKTLNSTLF